MHFSKALGISILLLLLGYASFSQENEVEVLDVNQRSYELYLNQNWEQLIAFGDSAVKAGNDFYYLRVRIGIAYFELKKYRIAEDHFRKAIAFNSFENYPQQYLYYCLLANGKHEESRALARKFSVDLQTTVGFNTLKIIDLIAVDYGRKYASNDLPAAGFLQVGLNHYVGNRFSLFHTFSNYSQGDDLFKNTQYQYYLGASIPLKNNYKLSAGFHYLYNDFYVDFIDTHFKGNNYIAALTLKKSINKFDFSIGSTGILLDSIYQYQHEAGINFYPLANSKINIGLNAIVNTADHYKTTYVGILPIVTFKPNTTWSLFTSYLYNKGNNISEWNGFLVNNSIDLTQHRINLGINYAISKKWEINAIYQHESKIESFTKDNYQYNSIFFGIKFKP